MVGRRTVRSSSRILSRGSFRNDPFEAAKLEALESYGTSKQKRRCPGRGGVLDACQAADHRHRAAETGDEESRREGLGKNRTETERKKGGETASSLERGVLPFGC